MENKNIIYGLRCPLTDDYKYIGKSSIGIARPKSHLVYSHNTMVNFWIKELSMKGKKPIIDIIEVCNSPDELLPRERYWIGFYSEIGCGLFNQKLKKLNKEVISNTVDSSDVNEDIAYALRHKRLLCGIPQDELSKNIGISRRTLVNAENGSMGISIGILMKIADYLNLSLGIYDKGGADDVVLWLDDLRNPHNHELADGHRGNRIVWVKDYDEFYNWICENGVPGVVSFDYDLNRDIRARANRGSDFRDSDKVKKNGYNCALFLINYCKDKKIDIPSVFVHSQNPEGSERIMSLFEK